MWKKGHSGNPTGRKRSQWREHFDALIAADAKKHKESIFEHAIEQACKDNALLAAILSKCWPDLKAVDAKIHEASPFKLIIDFSRSDTKKDKSSKKTQKREADSNRE